MLFSGSSRLDALSYRGSVEEDILLCDVVAELAQGSDVVENPEGTPMRGEDEIIILDHQVVHGRRRKVQLELTPVSAVVERHIQAHFRTGVKQTSFLRILPHRAHETCVRNSIGQLGPGLAVVAGLVDVGTHVVELVPLSRDIGRASVMRRGVNLADTAPLGQVFRCDIGPGLAFVARELNQSIVGTDPKKAFGKWRLGQGEDGVVVFSARVV